ncbi:hypothetical protein [Nostoc sphaeroides]|nr:hypothetical protein [Nostoc sphaeroides]
MCKYGSEMRLAVNKGTQQSWRRHRFTKGIAIHLAYEFRYSAKQIAGSTA